MAERRYRAFISYSHFDRAVAQRLHKRLESYVIPRQLRQQNGRAPLMRNPLRPIFLDVEELVPGPDLPQKVQDCLDASDYLIVVCSPEAATSEWVNKEVEYFCAARGRDKVLAVVVAGEPNATSRGFASELEALPLLLTARDGAGAELLWVDWRDKRPAREALLRLVAATLQLSSLDELVRRDARARKLTLIAGAVGLFAVALMAVGLWYLSLTSVGVQQGRFDKWFKASIAAEAAEYMVDGAGFYEAKYKVQLHEDLNGDGIVDFLVIDQTPGNSGSGGMSSFVAVGNWRGEFRNIGGYYASPWAPYTGAAKSGWRTIKFALPPDGIISSHRYDAATDTYVRSEFTACSGGASACDDPELLTQRDRFCGLDERVQLHVREPAPLFTFRESGNVEGFSEEALVPDKRDTGGNPYVSAVSNDGRWFIVMHRRDEGASFARAEDIIGGPIKRVECW